MRSSDISDFVSADLRRVRGVKPGATTLYRYRSTLHRLGLMSKQARLWRVKLDDPLVRTLVKLCPGEGASLVVQARSHFADVVLRHPDCKALLFDLFMPDRHGTLDLRTFCARSTPVTWRHVRSGKHSRLDAWNKSTGQRQCYEHQQAVLSVLYGLRYWLRDELGVVDEYAELGKDAAMLFAVHPLQKGESEWNARVIDAVRFILGTRSGARWTTLEVAELIRRYCVGRRQARRVLFAGIDWLCQHRPDSVALVPTPVSVATLSASNTNREHLELGRYYRDGRDRLICDIHIHVKAEAP